MTVLKSHFAAYMKNTFLLKLLFRLTIGAEIWTKHGHEWNHRLLLTVF